MRIVIRLMSVVTHGEDKKKTKIIYVVIGRIVMRLMPVVTPVLTTITNNINSFLSF